MIDLDLSDLVSAIASPDTTLTEPEFTEWAASQRSEHRGSGGEFVLRQEPTRDDSPELVTLDGTAQSTKDLVAKLHEDCRSDDVEEAEFEIDDLDPTLVGWVMKDALLALAGARSWDTRPGLHDIGVLVHPDHRKMRAGTRVVGKVVRSLLDSGVTPLYRCNDENQLEGDCPKHWIRSDRKNSGSNAPGVRF